MREAFLRRPTTVGEFAADGVRVIGLLSILVAAIWFSPTDAGILAFALPGLLLPRFLGVRPAFDLAYGVTILAAAWSNVLGLYTSIPGWDLVVHVLATGVIAAMLAVLLSRCDVIRWQPDVPGTRRVPLVIVPALGLAVSALWEVVEWVGYVFVTDEIFVTYNDTIADMVAGGLGAAAAGVLAAFVPLDAPAADGSRPTEPRR